MSGADLAEKENEPNMTTSNLTPSTADEVMGQPGGDPEETSTMGRGPHDPPLVDPVMAPPGSGDRRQELRVRADTVEATGNRREHEHDERR